MLDELRRGQNPFIAFVGAGASAIPPSRLPTWKGFNNLLLEGLCERLDEYSNNRQPTAQMLATFRARRDQTRFFAPDFQAQLIEEEVGADYFRVWQSLDTTTSGPVHAALAELASRGRLAAIITTNFDRLIEIALAGRGVAYDLVYDTAGFARLAGLGDAPFTTMPIVKIHGSIEDAASLVDTLRQRLGGRPPAMNTVLQRLLRAAPWVYVGFSGADFSYDPHYLGILDNASEAKGFVFLRQTGRTLEQGVIDLQAAFGTPKADIVDGELATWLPETFGLPAWKAPAVDSTTEAAAMDRVRAGIAEWAKTLGPVAAVNIVVSMLKSAGLEHEAFWLMRKTFKSYRSPDDLGTKPYQRYNYNYGVALADAGLISNPVVLADDKSNLPEWKAAADQNAFEFLSRSYKEGHLLAGGGALSAILAYRGQVSRAMGLASEVTREAVAKEAWLDLCDIAIASIVLYDVVQIFRPAAEQVEFCVEKAKALGDEPRRAMLSAHLGRLRTYAREYAEADAALKDAEGIASRLDLRKAQLTARAARGLWLAESGSSAEGAVLMLRAVVDELRATDTQPLVTKIDLGDPALTPTVLQGHSPMLCRTLVDLCDAAKAVGDGATISFALDHLDELTVEHFPGYIPHYYFTYADLLARITPPDIDKALDLVRRARALGEEGGNPWVKQYADALEPRLKAVQV